MKICYVITKADDIGGAQIHVRDLTDFFNKNHNEVFVITGEDGLLVDELKRNGITVIIEPNLVRQISPLNDIKAIFRLRRLFKNILPDIISLHSSKAGVIGRFSALFLSSKVIFTAHGWAFADGVSHLNRMLYIIIEKILAKLTDRIITVSKQDKDLALKHNVSNDNQQIVIHNGMLYKHLSHLKHTANPVVQLIMVARFSEQKDHRTLFYALSSLKDLDWQLELVGSGGLMYEIKELAVKLDIDDKILFSGQRDDVDSLLFTKDIFLLISNWEGFPRSILEGMRTGLPVIATNVGGVSESVVENETGYLIPRNDSKCLTEKLRLLIESSELRYSLGRSGKSRFLNQFTFEAMAEKTQKVYLDALASTKS